MALGDTSLSSYPTGDPTLSGQKNQYNINVLDQQRANLDAQRQASAAMQGLYSSMGTSGAYTPPGGYGAAGGAGHVAPMQMADQRAGNAAAFNSAKDQVGKTGQAALTGLQGSLAGRGMLGSGIEARGTEQLAEAGAGQLGEVSRQQAVTNAGLDQETARANY